MEGRVLRASRPNSRGADEAGECLRVEAQAAGGDPPPTGGAQQAKNHVEDLEASESSETLQRNWNVSIVRKNFNRDPKKGDLVLGGEQTSPVHPQGGHLLFPVQGQDPEQDSHGDYRGEMEELNLAMLHTFMELNACCRLSNNFCGEAQKIDKMMDAFSQQ